MENVFEIILCGYDVNVIFCVMLLPWRKSREIVGATSYVNVTVDFLLQFYTEVTEVETWIREKLPRVSSDDYGRDETSAQSLLRKHETLELELDSYRAKVNDLKNMCHALVMAGNFDKEKIQRRQVMIRELFYVWR